MRLSERHRNSMCPRELRAIEKAHAALKEACEQLEKMGSTAYTHQMRHRLHDEIQQLDLIIVGQLEKKLENSMIDKEKLIDLMPASWRKN